MLPACSNILLNVHTASSAVFWGLAVAARKRLRTLLALAQRRLNQSSTQNKGAACTPPIQASGTQCRKGKTINCVSGLHGGIRAWPSRLPPEWAPLHRNAPSRHPVVALVTSYNGHMATTIRPATRADVPVILDLIRALAAYEREPDAVTATEKDLLRDGFGENPYYACLIAEHDRTPAGFAFYFFEYSTWLGRPGLYLEDLFVYPQFRGLGIG